MLKFDDQEQDITSMVAGELQSLSRLGECTDQARIEKVGYSFNWNKSAVYLLKYICIKLPTKPKAKTISEASGRQR